MYAEDIQMTVKLLMLVVFFAVWVSFLIGMGITVSNLFLHYIASPINAGAIAMVAGLIAVPPVSLIPPSVPRD